MPALLEDTMTKKKKKKNTSKTTKRPLPQCISCGAPDATIYGPDGDYCDNCFRKRGIDW